MREISKMLTIHVKLILLACIINISKSGWNDVLNDIKQKAKEKFRNKYRNQSTINFLGYDLSQYPGTNAYFRNLNKDKWAAYYECLTAQDRNLGQLQSVAPVALAALEGGSVKLDCRICLSSDNLNDIHSVEWYTAFVGEWSLKPIEYDEHTLVTPNEKSLMMYNLRLDQTGQYMCSLGEVLTAPYFVTVVKSFESNIKEVHPKQAKHGPFPTPDLHLSQHNIRVSTQWGPWSPCSQCGKVGKRHRYGFCNVLFSNLEHAQTKRKAANIRTGKYLEILKLFQEGIPCSSHILPEQIKKISEVKNRKDEIMIGFCKEKCAEEKVFVVRDEHGNVLEKANNSAGIYSMLQGLPPAEPHIEKSLVYTSTDSDVVLTCPGNLNSDFPMQWQIGEHIVIPEVIAKQSEGRIFVSLTERIHVRKAKISDANIYSCWQHKQLAGMVRLVVEKKIKLNFNHHIMMLAMIIILFTFFWVFTKAFFGRKYARIKD